MKVFDPDAASRAHANGRGATPLIDDDEREQLEDDEEYEFFTLFDAPSYSDFIKTKPNSRAQTYEKRWQSMMKAGLIGSIHNEQWADAATFLKHGPGFAKAAGSLAAEDARMAQITEMLTAPDSPYVIFAMVTLPFVSQLFRNHETQIAEARENWRTRRAQRKAGNKVDKAPKPTVNLRFGKRRLSLSIPVRVKIPKLTGLLKGFLAPTQRPEAIQAEVFADPAVRQALHKMGIHPMRGRREDAA